MASKYGQKRGPQRTEKEVGIRLYAGKHERFTGVVKERFSDFHVNEIGPNGKILHLTSFELPDEPLTDVALSDPDLVLWVTEETRARIQALQDSGTSASAKVEINATAADKESRTKIHRWLAHFDRLQSETVETEDGDRVIQIFIPTKENLRFVRRPHNRDKYTHCLLYKEGLDTTDAINMLCRKLKLQPKHITYAGTKDKQAKTVQRVSFSNVEAKRLAQLNETNSHFKLGNFEYDPHPIRLGELKGNHFKILVKRVECESDEVIQTAVENLATNGFINYYGLQRFGTYKVPTYLVGKAIIQMKWTEVFDLILQPNSHDQPFMKAAKELWIKKRDATLACKKIPYYHKSLESSLLHGLAKAAATDYLAAFKSLPRNIRTLYIHAYQSWLWNQLATFRIEKFGTNPIVGDLVYENPELAERDELESGDSYDEDDDKSQDKTEEDSYKKPQVRILTEEDLEDYTIYDVLIPLQGTEVKFPDNAIKAHFDELLIENGIALDDFEKFQPRGELPRGDYRKVMVLPKNVSHKIIPYSDTDHVDSFIVSDHDLMKAGRVEPALPAPEFGIPITKDRKAVILEFSLPPSSYATMALRELIKGDDAPEDEEKAKLSEKRKLASDQADGEPGDKAKRAFIQVAPEGSANEDSRTSAEEDVSGNGGNGVHQDNSQEAVEGIPLEV